MCIERKNVTPNLLPSTNFPHGEERDKAKLWQTSNHAPPSKSNGLH